MEFRPYKQFLFRNTDSYRVPRGHKEHKVPQVSTVTCSLSRGHCIDFLQVLVEFRVSQAVLVALVRIT